jgi:hypothetical protein
VSSTETSATVADVRTGAARHARVVHIEITAGRGAPPSGVVVVDGRPGCRFDGWLTLLGLLADALDPDPPSGAAGGGELAEGGGAEFGEAAGAAGAAG